MKVIFLDIDGVLNSDLYIRRHYRPGVIIDGACLARVRRIVDATGARIVLSTSWREHWEEDADKCDETGREMNEIFASQGLRISDKTPRVHNARDEEITQWLREHPEVENFVVIDDAMFEDGILRDHFVLTSGFRMGIDEDDAEKAISILNRQ